ncbi:mitochondrial ribosomal protein S15 precursor, putative [Babesia microti strain RI]|uniref:Mitochondrial ribosomal protein S15, putative n=1 Tax=Babesia microti (strain RI) TaxID=1133968 RepID=A0A1R4AA79_BABMR|nr:mitochondrial ribosomal protein S15 precursor, putative [Babesia microti strain RI]SJK85899.1 mitochondrial ribosomal protein S15 precursor, putative [Babesia microti strain RI]|eukprot:XP_021338109.1 mitochondrial ribosomal protein S15 precursor, putative [Babesia microti strain RI]
MGPRMSRLCKILSPYLLNQTRLVAHVKTYRYTGQRAVQIHGIKSEWYLQAEKEFLDERALRPEGLIGRWHIEDLVNLQPQILQILDLKLASSREVMKARKLLLRRRLQKQPFDTGSVAVQLACTCEKILNLRAHLIKHPKDSPQKRNMAMLLSRRYRIMKYFYQTDPQLYIKVCQLLKIKCVLFAIPDSRSRAKAINNLGIDGDRCKFLIRQKLWWGRHRAMPVKLPSGKLVAYTRHIMEKPPDNFNMPKKHNDQISPAWPYGVKLDRLQGNYVIHNPTAPGLGYCPVPMVF